MDTREEKFSFWLNWFHSSWGEKKSWWTCFFSRFEVHAKGGVSWGGNNREFNWIRLATNFNGFFIFESEFNRLMLKSIKILDNDATDLPKHPSTTREEKKFLCQSNELKKKTRMKQEKTHCRKSSRFSNKRISRFFKLFGKSFGFNVQNQPVQVQIIWLCRFRQMMHDSCSGHF